MLIALSGTPGTGKHTLARRLSKELGYDVMDVNALLKGSDDEVKVSEEELNRVVNENIKDNMIIVSHLAHFLTNRKINMFIVLRCDPMVLCKRLKKRGYSKQKLYDNVMFEALDGSYIEATELHNNVVQIDNTKDIASSLRTIIRFIATGKAPAFKKDFSKCVVKIEKLLMKKSA